MSHNMCHKTSEHALRTKGLFNNCVTLKLLSCETPTPHHHTSSRIITKSPFCYVTLDTDTDLYHLFLIFEAEKKKIYIYIYYAPTHDTSTCVFKQLNQIVRFKQKIIKIELESLFLMNYLTRKTENEIYVHLSGFMHPSIQTLHCQIQEFQMRQ